MKKISVKTELAFQKVKDEYIKEPFNYGIYILTGKERLFKKAFIASMHSYMFPDEGDSEMNYSVFYDKNDAVGFAPLEVADTPPFGSKLRLIVIYKYNNFQEDFLEYCSNPSKTSIVILETESSLEEDPIYKYFSKKQNANNIYFIDFPLPDENDFRGLINAYVNKQGKKISTDAVEYLINNINLDYDSLYSELAKICNYNDKDYHRDFHFLRPNFRRNQGILPLLFVLGHGSPYRQRVFVRRHRVCDCQPSAQQRPFFYFAFAAVYGNVRILLFDNHRRFLGIYRVFDGYALSYRYAERCFSRFGFVDSAQPGGNKRRRYGRRDGNGFKRR